MRRSYLSPGMLLLLGAVIPFADVIIRGNFNPFVPLCFLLAALLEVIFRKQRFLPSNFLSVLVALVVVVALKVYVIDFMVVRTDRLEGLGIPKDAKVIVQKSFWKVAPGDVVVVKSDSDSRNYVGKVKEVSEGNSYALVSGKSGNIEQIERSRIAGKVIYVFESQQ